MRKLLFILVLLGFQGIYSQSALQVEKVTITVNSLAESVPFYEDLLGFKKIKENVLSGKELHRLLGIQNPKLTVKVATLQLGDEQIELQEFENEKESNQIPIDSKSNDLWFQHIAIVVNDMDKAYKKLQEHSVTHVSTAPQTLPEHITAAAGIKAFYFQDPDRHVLEIIYFPEGKGDPKWQNNSKKVFLGIDHTAICIAKTKIATKFYENLVGLKTMGHSENYGTEQEHLNQMFGARLWISGLKAQKGFGVEFLDYIAPPGGKEYPETSKPSDIWHWHTTIQVSDIEATYNTLQQENANFISKGIITFQNKKQFMIRDEDGHALLLTQ